jgi:adenylosuccinate lyase
VGVTLLRAILSPNAKCYAFCRSRVFLQIQNQVNVLFRVVPITSKREMSEHDTYENPLLSRYSSREMGQIWGAQKKFSTWRRLWVALAESQKMLGLQITQGQVDQLRSKVDDIDFDQAQAHEKRLRHDVMAHVHTYAEQCPDAAPIIHLGATSCYVTDNTDVILLKESLQLVAQRLAIVIGQLGGFAQTYRDLGCLGFTHLQPAQPTTVGKRACLWAYDLVMDIQDIEYRISQLKARGAKGTTGTQASFLKLFDGNHAKVEQLDHEIAQRMGFADSYAVTGQTYPRKVDAQVIDALSGLAQSTHKIATDLRLLANRKEIEEPFEKEQIGSSAMAYKRNPMRCERVCSLARFVISLQSSPANTLATQWMERTLDDSANRRLVLPQAFLAIDAILILMQNITSGLVVYPKVIQKHLMSELPFMATENILMSAVAGGGNRQQLHELIRRHSIAAASEVKEQGGENDLIDRLKTEKDFQDLDFAKILNPLDFVGRAPEQVDRFVQQHINPIVQRYGGMNDLNAELNV